MPDAAAWAGVIVGALSLAVSAVAVLVGWKAHREAIGVQRRTVEIEEQRERDKHSSSSIASLRPQLRKTDRGSYRLYLVNAGHAEARNVRVSLDGRPLRQHPAAVRGDEMPRYVGPNSEVSCLLAISHDCAPPFQIEVGWDDDFGTGRVYRGTLTF